MSSIYDALKRSQAEKQISFPMGPYGAAPSKTKKWYWAVLAAILVSSVCTVGILYSTGMLGPENRQVQPPVHTARTAATPTRPVVPVTPPPTQAAVAPRPAEPLQAKPQQAASVEPDRIWDLMKKADRLRQKGDLDGAIQAYTELTAMAPGFVEMKIKLGGLYYEAKQYDRALIVFQKALEAAPNNAKLLNNIGSAFLAKNETAVALKYFIQAHRNSSDYVEPLYNMACAYAKLKKNGAALSSLRQACIMQPEARLWAKRDPDLKSLKGDREFEEIVRAQ